MPKGRDYLIFGDLVGKLAALRIECTRCPRRGRYSVALLRSRPQRNEMAFRP
jgi:hypothetical protein